MWCVMVEWDGEKPPSRFYNRLSQMKLPKIRGDKEVSVVTRRAGGEAGNEVVRFNEGAFWCQSESLARVLSALCHSFSECKSCTEPFYTPEVKVYNPTDSDIETLARLNAVYGKRGHPAGEEQDWTIICHEEGKSYQWSGRNPTVCPNCHGNRITYRLDTPTEVPPRDDKTSLLDYWKSSRFATGRLEYPIVKQGSKYNLPKFSGVDNEDEEKALTRATRGNLIQDLEDAVRAGVLSEWNGLRAIDALVGVLVYCEKASRDKARLAAITEALVNGADPTRLKMVSGKELDEFDCALMLGPAQTASLHIVLDKIRKQKGV